MKVTIEIKCDSAAFGETRGVELRRILAKLCDHIENSARYNLLNLAELGLKDTDGNTVGHVEVTK